jgi:exopolysaccharide production protein ExoQ
VRTPGARSTTVLSVLENVFVVLALILFTGAFLVLLGGGSEAAPAGDQDGNRLAQAAYVGVYGMTCLFIVMRLDRFVYVSTREPILLLLIGIAVISVLWSVAPEITLRRSLALVGTTLFGVYLAMRFSLREQLRLLAWALGIAALLSVVLAVALPDYGVMSSPRGDALQGIYSQKNALGRTMALSALIFFFLALGGHAHRWLKWGGFGLSLVLLLLSGAKSSLVILATLIVLFPVYRALRETYTIIVPILMTCVLAGVGVSIWVANNVEGVLGALDRDVTLTGRTELWPAVLDMIAERPWLGYGYNAFWLGWEGKSAEIWMTLTPFAANFYPTHAHNGVLDLWLDLGFVGVLVFTLVFVLAFGRAVRLIRSAKATEAIWPLTYLSFMLLSGITYPIGLERNSIWWVLYVAVVVSLAAQPSRVTRPRNPSYVLDRAYEQKHWSRSG